MVPKYTYNSGSATASREETFSAWASIVRQGPIALATGAGVVVWIFFLSLIFPLFFLLFWETA